MRVRQKAQPALALLFLAACSRDAGQPQDPAPKTAAPPPQSAPADPYAGFPLHGLVQGVAVVVRKAPSPDAIAVGWLRQGERVRLKPRSAEGPRCRSGWHPIHPQGFVCAGEGIAVTADPPDVAQEDRAQADRSAVLPYHYYRVKEPKVPEYHMVPSRQQQRVVQDYVSAWTALLAQDKPAKLARFLDGELPEQPRRHPVVRRFLERGFFVAGTGVASRSRRRFVRTVRGSFVKEQQLVAKTAPGFQGVELKGEVTLPVAWAVRSGLPLRAVTAPDGSIRFHGAEDRAPVERLTVLQDWKRRTHLGGKLLHELADGTYLRHWFVSVAERIPRPKEVAPGDPWVHVDLGSQTLVLYEGDRPRYATLVSSGLDEHPTPTGTFRIRRKYVSDSMRDIGADADQRYSIDDVPWTQYFDGPRALHGAFWHSHFGMRRSHGCVNLSPADAFRVFRHTLPALPAGWHGVSTEQTGMVGSVVHITE